MENDLISRQAAIDALDKRFNSVPMEQTTEILLLRKDLRDLPPVQPQPKTGHWIKITPSGIYMCSECEHNVLTGDIDAYHHCHHCGIKMINVPDKNDGKYSEIPKGSDSQESKKINCKSTKCENCINHNYCDFESQESDET